MADDRAALGLAEQAYQDVSSDQAWLDGLLEHAGNLIGGSHTATAVTFRTDVPESIRPIHFAGPADFLASLQQCLGAVSPEVRKTTFAAGPVIVLSERIPRSDGVWNLMKANGVEEIVGFVCRDPGPIGCTLAFNLSRKMMLTPVEQRRLGRASAHVATALRLRVRKGAEEAVLAADGQLLDASGPARARERRDALQRAARSLDRSKARAKRDPEAALAAWRALVDGRWTLVERFDSDGRRFWIARENEPQVVALRRLSELERRVVGYLAVGHAQKLISYELGLNESTVSKLASSARQKLGVKTRAELIELHAALSARRD
jgi:DNA-binding CsgD family transcriptional regulator